MKRKIYFCALMAFVSVLFAGTGCSNSPGSDPLPRLPKGEFSIELSKITYSSVDIRVVPQDKTQTFYSHIVAKEAFAKNWKSDVTTFMTEYMAYLGEENGLSKAEVAAELIDTDDIEWDYDRLKPNAEYVVFAVGLDEQGVLTTTPVFKEFTAASLPAVVPVTCTFATSVSDISPTRALIEVTPSDKQVPYFFDIFPVASYPSGDATEFLTDFMRETVFNVMDQTGAPFEEAVTMLAYKGYDGIDLDPGTLKPMTQYYVVAFGIDAYGRPTTVPATKKFTTEAIIPSSNTFTIKVEDVTGINASAVITPTNDDSYYAQIFTKAELAGHTDEQILESIQSGGIIYATINGDFTLDAGNRLFPSTEYEVLVFGYNEGVTTAITRQSFTTLAGGDPARCQFEIDYLSEKGKVMVSVAPSDPTTFFFLGLISKADYTTDAALITDVEKELKTMAQDARVPIQTILLDYYFRGEAEALYEVESLQEYVIAVFALTQNGTAAGPVSKMDYTALEVIRSTAKSEIQALKYFSGSELYAHDSETYADGADNLTYVLTKVTHTEDAAHWYAAIFAGDLTESSDDNMIRQLVDFGAGEMDVERLGSWPWAYFFDVEYWGQAGNLNTLAAVAVDAEGNYGPVFKELFKPVTSGASPISELVGAKVAVSKGQSPHKFQKEQRSASKSLLTRRSDAGGQPHLIFAAPAVKPKVSSIVGLQKSRESQRAGNTSHIFGHGNTSLTK